MVANVVFPPLGVSGISRPLKEIIWCFLGSLRLPPSPGCRVELEECLAEVLTQLEDGGHVATPGDQSHDDKVALVVLFIMTRSD